MRGAILLLVASGCHGLWGIDDTRLFDARYFDTVPEIPNDGQCVAGSIANDFDSDGIVDDCDPCPQNPAATGDIDGDGIGDACDPRPTIKDTRIAFYAFRATSELAGWTTNGGSWSITPQGLVQSDPSTSARIDVPGGPYFGVGVDTGFVVQGLGATPYGGTCANLTASDYHCCNAEHNAGSNNAITAQAGLPAVSTQYPGLIGVGHELHLLNLSDASQVTCTLSEANSTATATLMEDSGGGTIALHTRDMAVAYRYLFIVKIGL